MTRGFAPKPFEGPVGGNEGVLGNVFRVLGLLHHLEGNVVNEVTVLLDNLVEVGDILFIVQRLLYAGHKWDPRLRREPGISYVLGASNSIGRTSESKRLLTSDADLNRLLGASPKWFVQG